MSRWVHIIYTQADILKAIEWVKRAPKGMRLEFKAPKRSVPQNDLMWALLTEIQEHQRKQGKDYTTDEWKVIFMQAVGREIRLLPALDGKGFVPYGQSSSDLSKTEMTDLIEFIYAWGAENNIDFKSQRESYDK